MLRIRLIGGLELDLDGHRCEPPRSRRARLLLAWLALHPGYHARGEVAGRFWPDVLDESARASLRVALTELRSALGPAAGCIVATRDTVALDGGADALWVDVREFGALLAVGRKREAVEAGSGELLSGLDDDWVHDARQEHAQSMGAALEDLAAEAQRAGDSAEAVRRSRAAVALDPLAEEPNRRLIERLARAGERAAALTAYDRLAERLRTTLRIAPSPATRALAGEIRRADGERPAVAIPPPPALRRPHESVFVGRAAELARVRDTWAGIQLHGTRTLALVSGEPGVGKTRLAFEVARAAHELGGLVLAGRCWEEPLAAYDPFAEVLRHCAAALGREALAALAGPTAPELGRLLDGSPAPAPDDAGARHRLFDAVDAVLSGLASERPLLLLLDDLHWADRPTLLLLAFVLRSARGAPVLVLGSCRDTEVGRRTPLAGSLADLQRDGVVERIALRGLERDDVELLADSWLGPGAGSSVASSVHERTAGNAFFAEEVLRGLVERSDGIAPESVRHAVGARLERLGEPAMRLLAVASVLRGEFGAELLAAVSGLGDEAAEEALDELLGAHLLRPCTTSPRRFEFPHALVREVVYDELNALRRSRLHRRVAAELIARDPERNLEDIAHHLFESASAGEEQRTAGYLERAGRHALELLSYEAAAEHFERALQVIGPSGELRIARGDALLRAGDPDAARECFRAAAAVARERDDPALLARAALGHAGIGVTIVDVDAAVVALLEEALDALGDADPSLRSQLLGRLAVELYYAPQRDRSEALSAAAVVAARRAADSRTLAAALGARHVALWRPDRLAERLEAAGEMIAAARDAGDAQLELQARNWRVSDLFELGDIDGWRAEAARHAELAEHLRLPSYTWYTPLWQAVDALHQGRFAEVEEPRERARALGSRAGDRNADLFADMLRFGELLMRGDYAAMSVEWVEEKIERSPAGVAYRPGYAWTLAGMGREQEARAQIELLAPDGFTALPFDANWLTAMGELAETCILLRDPTHADAIYELLAPYAGRPLTAGRAVISYGVADRHLGGLAALLERRGDAARHFEEARRLNAAMGMRSWVERTELALAQLIQHM